MSDFLDCEPGVLIALGSSIQQMKDEIDTALTSRGWRALRKRVVPTAFFGTIANYTYAFDTDPNTAAGANGAATPLNLGFQAPSGFTPVLMTLQSPQYTGNLVAAPRDFSLDYSDNGTNWTTLQSWANEPAWIPFEVRTFAVSGAGSHAYWRLTVTATVGSQYLGLILFDLQDASGLGYTSTPYTDIAPPATEDVGNATGHDVCRIVYSGSAISFFPRMELLTPLPKIYSFTGPTGGAVTLSITVGGATVQYTGASGDSAAKNGRKLYEAVRASVNANFTDLNWYYRGGVIWCSQKTPSQSLTITSSNITANADNHYAPAGPQRVAGIKGVSISCDLVSGFIYYMQINARGFAIATKLNSGFYGPVHVCWEDHTKALYVLPEASHPLYPPLVPIEMVIGTNGATADYADGIALVSHVWGVPDGSNASPGNPEVGQYGVGVHPFTRMIANFGDIVDMSGSENAAQGLGLDSYPAYGGGMFVGASGTDAASLFKLHKMSVFPSMDNSGYYNTGTFAAFVPGIVDIDWYRNNSTLTNEQVVMAAMDDFTASVAAGGCSNTDVIINVDSTSGWPSSGTLVLDGEVIYYASKTSTSFNACTRGQKGSLAMSHYHGDKARVGGYFIKINNGLIFCGYAEPT